MAKFTAIFAIAALVAVGVYGNLTIHAIIASVLGVFIAGLTAAIAGILIATKVLKVNYETAFRSSFRWGAACGAAVILLWTGILDLLSGGITVDLMKNLAYAAFHFGFLAFALACAVVLSWDVCVWRTGRKNGQ